MAEAEVEAPASIYLDWNATTPPHPRVLDAMRDAQACWANPASVHRLGRAARAVVDTAREELARVLGLDARDVLFTSGGTEANNLALHAAPLLITSRLEHPSVVRIAERLEREKRTRWLPVPSTGSIEPETVARALVEAPQGSWVSVMAANHETGVVQPVAELARVVHRHGARLHVDAAQALGKMELSALAEADAISVCAHKLRGPKGIGAVGWRHGAQPTPLLVGGAQERGLRPGSQDAVLSAGFLAALRLIDVDRHQQLERLRDDLERALVPPGQVNGDPARRLPHVSNLSFARWKADELVAALDLRGVCVSAGSACSAGTTEPSPVISSMLGPERALSAVRISIGEATTPSELQTAAFLMRELVMEPGVASP